MKKLTLIAVLVLCLLVYGEANGLLTSQTVSAFNPALSTAKSKNTPKPAVIDEIEPVQQIEYLDVEPGTSKQLFVASNGVKVPYVLRVPANATPDMPVIFWLHGMGYLGKNLPEDYGVIHKANELNEERFIIVQPTAYYGWHVNNQFKAVMELVDFITTEYRADSNRVLLAGHSLGAIGAWYYAENAAEYWAAVVPVANYCTVRPKAMCEMDFAVWAFCGEWDNYDNRHGSEETINMLAEKDPYRDVRYIEMEGCSHNDMAEAPYTEEFFDWAAAQYR